jgi:hypothetical protein
MPNHDSRNVSVFPGTYPGAAAVYVLFFAALTFPYWLRGEVVAPYRPGWEIGAPAATESGRIENRKFGDHPRAYIPEITRHFYVAPTNDRSRTDRSGWLALWSDQNELGRPLHHVSGFSPAYPPSWLIARVAGSPHRFLTVLSLGTCFLSGLFLLMFCREIGLSPLAGLLAAGGTAASPPMMYWLTFPMFLAAWCWSAGALYGVTRLLRKPDLMGWCVLALSVYSLWMTAYPQIVIHHAYLLAGYSVFLAFRCRQSSGWMPTVRRSAIVVGAVATGGLLALPVYADLAHAASESARAAPDPSFFTAVLPKCDSLWAAARWLILGTYPEVFGNPIASSYPLSYDGLSITPLTTFLALGCLFLRFRATWGWWLAVGVLGCFAWIHPLYEFGVAHLGFNVSRGNPVATMVLPMAIVAACGADAMIRREPSDRRVAWAVGVAAGVTLLVLLAAVAFGRVEGLGIRRTSVVMSLLVVCLLAAQFRRPRPALLAAALAVVAGYVAFPMMLRQDPAETAVRSPLVARVRGHVPPGARFAIAAPGLSVLSPNLNAGLGLPSVHSYNSLSPRRYHALMEALGGEMRDYGRHNLCVSPDYGGAAFWTSNISLVLSPTRLDHPNLDYDGQVGEVHLHRVVSRMGCCLQVPFSGRATPEAVQVGDLRGLGGYHPARSIDQGDLLQLVVEERAAPSLLILSRKYHRDWRAEALTSSGWADAKTLPFNGAFQGVLLPGGTREARLRFMPSARHAWIAHLFWTGAILVLACRTACSASRRRRLLGGHEATAPEG